MKKMIATALPIFSLKSKALLCKENGTFTDGLVFLDWLKATGQSGWQILPLSQTHLVPGSKKQHVPSPYRGYGVGLDPKFLSMDEREYDVLETEKKTFIKKNKAWLDDYAFFCALRDHFGTDDWTSWPPQIRRRDLKAMKQWHEKLSETYNDHVIEQFRLHKSYFEMKKKAGELDISIIGDMPYYLPLQSPLVWVNQRLFTISTSGHMRTVSGIPDSPKAHFGRQMWGHPLYNWSQRSQWPGIIKLWKMRLHYLNQLYNLLRLDHATGFYYYGAMNLIDPTKDRIKNGPGYYAVSRIIKYAKKIGLELFAEDASDRFKELIQELRKTLRKQKVPGIKIIRFAYNEQRRSFQKEYANIKSYRVNTCAYTTTHDTQTLIGYLKLLTTVQRKALCKKIKIKYSISEKILAERLRDAVLRSPARIVIIPIQDWLLTQERINIPGTEKMKGDKNWKFHLSIPIEKLPINSIKKHVIASTK
ncbi:MAG: hypothetical protein A2017_05385 [Lentisphaerae bacterium GWF2_44_16]|nr:MAG: hypothetical protein A2017_05385 [Lentisphaerae bacterium GWF2_44_16]HAU66584.1 hypothetical protein [Candidatus Uhrbacteria bacterium]